MFALSAGQARGTEKGDGRRGVIVRRPAAPPPSLTVRQPVEPEVQVVYLDELAESPDGGDGLQVVFSR